MSEPVISSAIVGLLAGAYETEPELLSVTPEYLDEILVTLKSAPDSVAQLFEYGFLLGREISLLHSGDGSDSATFMAASQCAFDQEYRDLVECVARFMSDNYF